MGPFARLFRRSHDDALPTFEVATTIGAAMQVRGDFRGAGGVRVEGTVTGSVESDGPVVVGESGSVDGNVRGSVVIVLGRVRGDVRATGHLEVGRRGKVLGDVSAESLRVHKGGVFRGTSRMLGADEVVTTSPFGMLGVPALEASETPPEEAAVRGRTLPPPAGAVPPPPESEERVTATVARTDREIVSQIAPPLPERPRAANADD